MSKYWFKPKRYGWGFYPISIEGWICTIILILILLLSAHINNILTETATLNQGLRFFIDVLLIAGVGSYLFEKKTDGKLKWNWG